MSDLHTTITNIFILYTQHKQYALVPDDASQLSRRTVLVTPLHTIVREHGANSNLLQRVCTHLNEIPYYPSRYLDTK